MATDFAVLKTSKVQLVLYVRSGARPRIVYWGDPLAPTSPADLARLSTRQHAHGGPDVDIAPSLSNEIGAGFAGPPGFEAHRARRDWATVLNVSQIDHPSDLIPTSVCMDPNTQTRAQYDLSLDPQSHLLTSRTSITNLADEPLSIDWCAALCVPLDTRLEKLIGFTGRWADEFQTQDIAAFRGSYVRENRSGRTSHDNFPGLVARAKHTNQTNGPAAGFHLGWSGNNRVRVDRLSDGQAILQMGELFFPGELELGAGETYQTPSIFAAWSSTGLNGLSRAFHTHLRETVMSGRLKQKPRPVHYNTWEAVYFDQSEDKLMALANAAADVGAERFVLDDGWFGRRRNDAAGLGDWTVSEKIYPRGLLPLADHVRALGMEFGIWFEPEMVNPDSDLFRAHPDWLLQAPGVAQIPSRKQYALDLTRADVCDYLFEAISRVIRDTTASYIKWDMNRNLQHPGSDGISAAHNQTLAVYALMRRLRDAFPDLEIESCSSGGARADFGVLQHTDRIWTSDSNDARDRQAIQRGASYFFPPEVMGCHVGPRRCHITGRVFSMEYRAATAMLGHMGMELNLLTESEADLSVLKQAIAVHKSYRHIIHHADVHRMDAPPCFNVLGIVAADQSEAIFSVAKTDGHATTLPDRLHIEGLNPGTRYVMRLIWPAGNVSVTSPSIVEAGDLAGAGMIISGEALRAHGMQLPLIHPDTCLIYHFQAVASD